MCQLDVYSHRTKYSCDVTLFNVHDVLKNYGYLDVYLPIPIHHLPQLSENITI